MSIEWIIIDGYSLLHAQAVSPPPTAQAFHRARQDLIRDLDRLQRQLADRVTVVFDGQQYSRETAGRAQYLEIIYAPAEQTADAVIEELVFTSPQPGRILVVTSDRAEQATVAGRGCHTQSCAGFMDSLSGRAADLDQARRRINRHNPRTRLGDFFPEA